MRILVMRVPDFVEKVDTFRAREERRTDRVHVRVAPTLLIYTRFPRSEKKKRNKAKATHMGDGLVGVERTS